MGRAQSQIKASVKPKRRRDAAYQPRPKPGCGLCDLGHTDPLICELWAVRRHERPDVRARETRKILRSRFRRGDYKPKWVREGAPKTLAEPTLEHVDQHFALHRPLQPSPTPAALREDYDRTVNRLSERERRIIRFVGQAGMAVPAQIAELFFGDVSSSDVTRRKICERAIRRLAYRHYLFRVPLEGRPLEGPAEIVNAREIVCLGAAGAEMLSADLGGRELAWDYINHPEQIGKMRPRHDIGAVELFVQLFRSAREPIELGGRRVKATLLPENFYGRRIAVSMRMPYRLDSNGQPAEIRPRTVIPDGFAAVGVETDKASFLMPMLLEHDRGRPIPSWKRGRRIDPGVAEQLYSHVQATLGRIVGRRFPELAVDDYGVPVVFSTRSQTSTGEIRIDLVRQQTRELLAERGVPVDIPVPVFLVLAGDVERLGLLAPVLPLMGREDNPDKVTRLPMIEVLAAASAPLIKSGRLTANSVLHIDHAAARPGKGGAERGDLEVVAEQAKEDAAQADLEEYEREMAEIRAQGESAAASTGKSLPAAGGPPTATTSGGRS